MPKYPTIQEKDLLKFVKKLGFEEIRTNGSHVRLKAPDGRVTTIPVHAGKDVPKGILGSIVTKDLEMKMDEFFKLYKEMM